MARNSKGIGGGCGLALFGLPFATVGLVCGAILAWTLNSYFSVQSWIPAQAHILRADLNESTDSEGDTTYSVEADYTYALDGFTYTSSRVGLWNVGNDNIGSWHEDKYNVLVPYVGSVESFPCYVNPENPADAILFRELRVPMVLFLLAFACIFGSVGLGLMAAGVFGRSGTVKEAARKEFHPTEPWTWKKEWVGGRIESGGRAGAYGTLVIGAFWVLICSPFCILLPMEGVKEGNYGVLIVFVLLAVGLLILFSGFMQLARLRKYGISVLQLEGPSGVLGGYLRGVVQVPGAVDAPGGVRAALRCIEKTETKTHRNGKTETSTSSNTLWESERMIQGAASPVGLNAGGVSLPIEFVIPYALPEPGRLGNKEVLWRLELSAATPGLDYSASFEVPVFKTAESQEHFTEQAMAPAAAAGVPAQPAMPLDPRTVRVDVFVDGMAFTYPRTRNLVAGIWFLAFTAGFGAILPVMY
jgi:hypothetical protein